MYICIHVYMYIIYTEYFFNFNSKFSENLKKHKFALISEMVRDRVK